MPSAPRPGSDSCWPRPTIVTHGTRQQIDTYVRDIVTGRQSWCQLFSEPAAGSDLAGLQTRAVRDGDEWIVNGQKVWTSGGHYADLGMLLARTDPDVPKHQGITYFAFPMHQPGVEVRPLREMTGRALFNEVFMTDARVGDDAVIGGENHGWAVANTTLMNERAGLGSGAGSPMGSGALPGTVAGHLHRRAGDFVARGGGRRAGAGRNGIGSKPEDDAGGDSESGALGLMSGGADLMITLAKGTASGSDPLIRQDLARLYTLGELGRFNALRLKAAKQSGKDIPGMPNIAKLSMSQIIRLSRDLGLRIVGAGGMLHAYDDAGRKELVKATGSPRTVMVTELALLSPAPSIYGGTDQIQRNIIGERVLGLPEGSRSRSQHPLLRASQEQLRRGPGMSGICEGRVVVVTGAGRGIGRGHAIEFARQGAKVVVNDLGAEVDGSGSSEGPAGEVVEEIRGFGAEAVANGEDVSDWEGARRLIGTAIDTFGGLDVLVNNAGILRDRMLVNMTDTEWDAVIRVHLRGTFAPDALGRRVLARPGQGRRVE